MEGMLDVDALRETEAHRDPFSFLVVPDFIRPTALDEVIGDFPTIQEPRNHDIQDLDYGPAFARLMEELRDPALVDMLGEKLGVSRLSKLPSTRTIRGYCEASDGHIHTDHWSKVVTVLLYPNHEWTSSGGRLRILRSATDLEDYVAEVEPVGGTLVAFARSPISYHGHHKHVGRRRMLQLNWLRRNPFARVSQTVSRHITHFAKRVGIHSDQ